ncbi:MAG TPA: SCO family protein [Chitinophagaceae bacterium]|nr:SCO family protein [Chitinophagaceae bacterium]
MTTISKKGSFLKGDLEFKAFGKKLTISKKTFFYTSFFIVLAAAFYLLLIAANPLIGKRSSPPVSYVRPFSFINQDGNKITEKDVLGKVYVAEYFFTTCKGICPKMNNNMRLVYERFKDNNSFLILSHTCDPETDSAAQLKKYADSMAVNTSQWIFLTGRKDSLYTMARISYTIDDPANNLKSIDDDFLHTQFWALVDRNGDVKKIYDGLKGTEVRQLIKDAERLLKEK